jgi:hypothetical protein
VIVFRICFEQSEECEEEIICVYLQRGKGKRKQIGDVISHSSIQVGIIFQFAQQICHELNFKKEWEEFLVKVRISKEN